MAETLLNEPSLEILIVERPDVESFSAAPPKPVPTTAADRAKAEPSTPSAGSSRKRPWLRVFHVCLVLALVGALVTLNKILAPASPSRAAWAGTAPLPTGGLPQEMGPRDEPPAVAAPEKSEVLVRAPEPVEPSPVPAARRNGAVPQGNGTAAAPAVEPGPTLEELKASTLLEEAAKLAASRPAEAAVRYAQLLDLRPDRTELWKKAAELHGAAGDVEGAVRAYRLFLKFHPRRPEELNALGVAEMRLGRLEEAQKAFEEALAVAPDANLYYNLGNLYLKKGGNEPAKAAYRRALECDPRHEKARLNLAVLLEREGRLAEAAAALADPGGTSAEAARERARLQAMIGGAEARQAFETARTSPDSALVFAAAAGFRSSGELEKAVALLDRALELSPRDPALVCNRGAVRQAMGNPDGAAEDYEAALKIDPGYADAHFNLGVLAEERGKYKSALDRYAAALKLRPSMAAAHNNVGVLYLKVNQPAKAAECFRRAVEADAGFAPARLNLGWAYLAAEERDRALAEFKAYAALVPKEQRDAAAMEAIEKLERGQK